VAIYGVSIVIGLIEDLHNLTTINYKGMANSNNLQFTAASIKSSQSAVFYEILSGNGFQRRRLLKFIVDGYMSVAYLTAAP
jgi:hypothetical protein